MSFGIHSLTSVPRHFFNDKRWSGKNQAVAVWQNRNQNKSSATRAKYAIAPKTNAENYHSYKVTPDCQPLHAGLTQTAWPDDTVSAAPIIPFERTGSLIVVARMCIPYLYGQYR
jgi:hypothetical protein